MLGGGKPHTHLVSESAMSVVEVWINEKHGWKTEFNSRADCKTTQIPNPAPSLSTCDFGQVTSSLCSLLFSSKLGVVVVVLELLWGLSQCKALRTMPVTH